MKTIRLQVQEKTKKYVCVGIQDILSSQTKERTIDFWKRLFPSFDTIVALHHTDRISTATSRSIISGHKKYTRATGINRHRTVPEPHLCGRRLHQRWTQLKHQTKTVQPEQTSSLSSIRKYMLSWLNRIKIGRLQAPALCAMWLQSTGKKGFHQSEVPKCTWGKQ